MQTNLSHNASPFQMHISIWKMGNESSKCNELALLQCCAGILQCRSALPFVPDSEGCLPLPCVHLFSFYVYLHTMKEDFATKSGHQFTFQLVCIEGRHKKAQVYGIAGVYLHWQSYVHEHNKHISLKQSMHGNFYVQPPRTSFSQCCFIGYAGDRNEM